MQLDVTNEEASALLGGLMAVRDDIMQA